MRIGRDKYRRCDLFVGFSGVKSPWISERKEEPFETQVNSWKTSGAIYWQVMPIVDDRPPSDGGGSKLWGILKLPFRSSRNTTPHTSTLSSSYQIERSHAHKKNEKYSSSSTTSVSSLVRSLLPTRRRLRLDPRNKLYFPCMNLLHYFLPLLLFLFENWSFLIFWVLIICFLTR